MASSCKHESRDFINSVDIPLADIHSKTPKRSLGSRRRGGRPRLALVYRLSRLPHHRPSQPATQGHTKATCGRKHIRAAPPRLQPAPRRWRLRAARGRRLQAGVQTGAVAPAVLGTPRRCDQRGRTSTAIEQRLRRNRRAHGRAPACGAPTTTGGGGSDGQQREERDRQRGGQRRRRGGERQNCRRSNGGGVRGSHAWGMKR